MGIIHKCTDSCPLGEKVKTNVSYHSTHVQFTVLYMPGVGSCHYYYRFRIRKILCACGCLLHAHAKCAHLHLKRSMHAHNILKWKKYISQ